MEGKTIYTLEILQGSVIIVSTQQGVPFPFYKIGMQVTIGEGEESRSYTVRKNCIGTDDVDRQYPLRQTLIVD